LYESAEDSAPELGEEGVNPEEAEGAISAWLNSQFWYLVTGVMFGVAANFISRMWAVQKGPPPVGGGAGGGIGSAHHFSHDNKMVFVINSELGMGKGKVAAQCAHAAIICYKKATKETPQLLKQWELFGQAKVTLKTGEGNGGLAALQELEAKAKAMGMVAAIVRDAGRTQVEAGSPTVLGIGPAPTDAVNQITGHLKLY